jgi:hypothetical protein
MHDDIATAENGNSQADVDERVLQGLVCFQFETQAARCECFSPRGLVLYESIT